VTAPRGQSSSARGRWRGSVALRLASQTAPTRMSDVGCPNRMSESDVGALTPTSDLGVLISALRLRVRSPVREGTRAFEGSPPAAWRLPSACSLLHAILPPPKAGRAELSSAAPLPSRARRLGNRIAREQASPPALMLPPTFVRPPCGVAMVCTALADDAHDFCATCGAMAVGTAHTDRPGRRRPCRRRGRTEFGVA
jgi:hypothetical protein